MVSRYFDKQTKKITLNKIYVATSDCIKHSGKIITLNMDGEYQFENDFVFGAGSIGTGNAEFICAVYESVKAENLSKGI